VPHVRDQPAGEPRIGQGLADDTGLAVMQRPLGVEQVGNHAGTAARGVRHLPRGRVAVPDADQDAGLGQPGDGRPGAVAFWCQRDQPEHAPAGFEQVIDSGGTRIGDPGLVVGALAGRGDERALRVHPEHPRRSLRQGREQRRRGSQGRAERARRCGDERGQEGRGAGLWQPGRHRGPAVGSRGHELDAEVAVDLEVHEARQQRSSRKLQIRIARRRPSGHGRHHPGAYRDVAGFKDLRSGRSRYHPRCGDQHLCRGQRVTPRA
jgi:hypothetical protein